MEEAKGVVKHVLLAKFKEGIPSDEIEKLIKGYANLVNLIEPMKAFEWGTDVSIENMHQGFTHIFESTFESKEGIAEYIEFHLLSLTMSEPLMWPLLGAFLLYDNSILPWNLSMPVLCTLSFIQADDQKVDKT
ncbi:Dabb domain-containing protein [Populus alba x Populus x berolinensis]|nr:Dabb domain-containing protein [Populus alba x Populus x berolinensis]